MCFKKDRKLRRRYQQTCEGETFYEYGNFIEEMDLEL